MKKTLFLTAILGAVFAAPAMAETTTTVYSQPAFTKTASATASTGTEWTWNGTTYVDSSGNTNTAPGRSNDMGPHYIYTDAGYVVSTNTSDTSDGGGVSVTGKSIVTMNLGTWGGSIYVGQGSQLFASTSYMKSTEVDTCATVYVDGTLTITNSGNLPLSDGGSQRWFIGTEGAVNMTSITGVAGLSDSRTWDVQIAVGDDLKSETDANLTNRTLSDVTATRVVMTTGAGQTVRDAMNSVTFFDGDTETDAVELVVSGNNLVAQTVSTVKRYANMALTTSGDITWVAKGTETANLFADADGTATSFVNGDTVTIAGHTATLGGNVKVAQLNTTGESSTISGSTYSITNSGSTYFKGTESILSADLTTTDTHVGVMSGSNDGSKTAALVISEGATLTTGQLRMSEQSCSTVTVNGTLNITGNANNHNTSDSLLLAHWGDASTLLLNSTGALNAASAIMYMNWNGTGTFDMEGGTAIVKGINFERQTTTTTAGTLKLAGGTLTVGSEGIINFRAADSVQLSGGTLKASAAFGINCASGSEGGIKLADGTTSTIDNNGRLINIGAAISGTGTLKKVGDGQLNFKVADTIYAFSVQNGTVTTGDDIGLTVTTELTNSDAKGATSSLTVDGDLTVGSVDYKQKYKGYRNNITVGGDFTSNGAVHLGEVNSLTVAGAALIGNNLTLDWSATATLGDADATDALIHTFKGAVKMDADSTLTINGVADFVIDAADLIKNDYTKGTTQGFTNTYKASFGAIQRKLNAGSTTINAITGTNLSWQLNGKEATFTEEITPTSTTEYTTTGILADNNTVYTDTIYNLYDSAEYNSEAMAGATAYYVANGATFTLSSGGSVSSVKQTDISVAAGGTLASTAVDTLGWGSTANVLKSLTLEGTAKTDTEAAKYAKWTMTKRQTLKDGTTIVMNGTTSIEASGDTTGSDAPMLDIASATLISVTGKDNKVSVPLKMGSSLTINTANNAELTYEGTLKGSNRLPLSGIGTVILGDTVNDLTDGSNGYAIVGSGNLNVTGTAYLNLNSSLETNSYSKVGMGSSSTITVKKGGMLSVGAIMNTTSNVSAANTGDNAAVAVEEDGALYVGNADTTVMSELSNAGYTSLAGTTIIGAVSGTGTLEVGGALSLKAAAANISNLTLSGGSVTLGSESDHNYTLTTSTLKVTADSTVNANLDLRGGKLVHTAGSIELGCTLTLNGTFTVNLTNDEHTGLTKDTPKTVTLITSIETATLSGWKSRTEADNSTTYFTYATASQLDDDTWDYVADTRATTGSSAFTYNTGTHTLMVTPEPATATLSLLALAGLCARRRRH